MSGPICPDCDSFEIEDIPEKEHWQRCGFCSWEGESLPYKSMGSDMLYDHNDEFALKKQKREEGKLHILRVYVDRNNDEDDTGLDLVFIFDLTQMGGARGDPPYFYIETEVEPTSEVLKKARALERVVDVKIF